MEKTAESKKLPTILGSLRKFISIGKTEQGGNAPKVDTAALAEKIRSNDLFKTLPEPSVGGIVAHMESMPVSAGDAIINEGDEGEYYYFIINGEAEVVRTAQTGKPRVVAQLRGGDGFGEEALISNAKRNATVRMKTGGQLIRLSRNTFNDFIKETIVNWLSPTESQRKVNEGAKWVDAREYSGGAVSRLKGSISAPLSKLREAMGGLAKDVFYVCYCENGRMSSTAAFLLVRHGFKAGVLRGGLQGLRRAGLIGE